MADNRILSFIRTARGLTNHDLWQRLSGKEFEFEDATTEEKEQRQLISHLCSLMLKPNKGREPFEPILVTDSGTSAQLSMFASTVDKIVALVSQVDNPVVASRALDVLWCLNPRNGRLWETINTYILAAIQLIESADDRVSKIREAMSLLGRAIDLDRMGRGGGRNDANFAAVAEKARLAEPKAGAIHSRLAALKVLRRIGDVDLPKKLDQYADELFVASETNPMLLVDAYPEVIDLYGLEFEESVKLRERGALFLETAAAGAEHATAAHYLGAALALIGRSTELAEIGRRITHKLQAESFEGLFSLKRVSHSVDISEMRIETLRAFSDLTCGSYLLQFAALSALRPAAELKRDAEEHLSSGFIHTLFAATIMDDAGRQVFLVPGAMGSKEEYERRVRFQISQEAGMSRGLFVSGRLQPLFMYARASFMGLSTAARILANASAFVRPARREIFGAGLAAYFDLDFSAASRILIPEIEGNIRYLIERLGGNPYDRDEEGNFLAQGLGAMLSRHEALLTKSLGADLLFEIDGLLLYRGGPSVRTEVAHALGLRYGPDSDSIYGCHLALRLCCGYIPPDNVAAVKSMIDQNTDGTFWPREIDQVVEPGAVVEDSAKTQG
jgi:hypothetical protein